MADEAKRDAKLSLKFDTSEAVKGMKEVERAGAKVADVQKEIKREADNATQAIQQQGRAAESAAKTIERYGANELKFAPLTGNRMRKLERDTGAAIKRVEDYRLAKHYEGLRAQRANVTRYGEEIDAGRAQASASRQAEASKYESEMAAARARGGQSTPSTSLIAQVVSTVASIAGVATIVKAVADEGRARFRIEGNVSTTQQQKDRANLGWWPWKTVYAADTNEERLGITESVRQARERQARDNALRVGHWTNESMRLDLGSQANIARREDFELRGATVPGGGPVNRYDRSTVAGERMHQEELRRLSGYDASADAQRRALAARSSVGDAENQLASIERTREQARHRQEQARSRYRTLGGQGLQGSQANVRNPEVEHALADWNAANQDVDRLNQMRVDQIQRIRDLSVNASQAEAQARQRNIDLMRTELQIAEQRTQNLIGAAERFGAMNPLQQQLAAQALRAVRDRGIRGVTPEVLGLAGSLDPQFVGMAQRNAAEANPNFQQLRREGFLDTGAQGTIAQNQAATEQLRQQIREMALESQQRLAEEMSGVLSSTFERILRTFNDRMTALENQFSQQQQNQFNQQ